jgi:hypothetical protein
VRKVSVLTSLLLALIGLVVVGTGSSAGAATLDVCPSGCSYSSIKDAVAAANPGDTVEVGPGTYTEAVPIAISKPVTIRGAGADSTTVLGNPTVHKQIFDIRTQAPSAGAGPVTLDGMTLRNAGSATYDVYVGVKTATTGVSAVNLTDMVFDGDGQTSYGIYADSEDTDDSRIAPPLTISGSTFTGLRDNNVAVDAWRGAVTIAENSFNEGSLGNSSVLVFNEYKPNRLTDPVVIRDNTSVGRLVYVRNLDFNADLASRGGFDDVTIADNTVTGLSGTDAGVLVSTNSADGAAPTRMGNVRVEGNTLRGDGSTGTAGVVIGGYVDDATVTGNDIVGVGDAVRTTAVKGQSPQIVTVQKNRLFADTNGLANDSAAAVDATGNWWGCQAGPKASTAAALAYCSRVANTGAGSVDASTWVVTTVATSTSTLQFGSHDQAIVGGTLGKLNTGAPSGLGDFFVGLPAAFAAEHGSVNPTTGTLDANLSAGTVYSLPSKYAKTDVVTVALDRVTLPSGVVTGEPVQVPLTIKPAPLLNLHLSIGGGTINLGAAIGNLLGGVLVTVDVLIHLFD